MRIVSAVFLVAALSGCSGRLGTAPSTAAATPTGSDGGAPTVASVCKVQPGPMASGDLGGAGYGLVKTCWILENKNRSAMVIRWGPRARQPIAPCTWTLSYGFQAGEWTAEVGKADATGDIEGPVLAQFKSDQLESGSIAYLHVTIDESGIAEIRQTTSPPDLAVVSLC